MRIHLIAAGVAAAACIPSLALAQQPCDPRPAANSGSIGAAVSAAVTGAVFGRPAAGAATCVQATGYYDNNGVWHATAAHPTQASGYYDRDGRWVNAAPNGYYDAQGRWVTAAPSAGGYYERDGRYVTAPAGASGNAPGHYDRDGRWVTPTAAAPAGGYYDAQGRWHVAPAAGYYDAQGRWIATGPAPSGYAYGHADAGMWAGAPVDIAARRAWLGERIQRGINEGRLSRREGARALQALNVIRREETALRNRRGMLTARNQSTISAKLDALNAGLRWSGQAYSRVN